MHGVANGACLCHSGWVIGGGAAGPHTSAAHPNAKARAAVPALAPAQTPRPRSARARRCWRKLWLWPQVGATVGQSCMHELPCRPLQPCGGAPAQPMAFLLLFPRPQESPRPSARRHARCGGAQRRDGVLWLAGWQASSHPPRPPCPTAPRSQRAPSRRARPPLRRAPRPRPRRVPRPLSAASPLSPPCCPRWRRRPSPRTGSEHTSRAPPQRWPTGRLTRWLDWRRRRGGLVGWVGLWAGWLAGRARWVGAGWSLWKVAGWSP